MHVPNKMNQEPQRNVLLGDTTRDKLERSHRKTDIRLVRIHQDLGCIADRGNYVDFIVGPSVFAKHTVLSGYIVDGYEEQLD